MADVRKPFAQAAGVVLKQIQKLESTISGHSGDQDTLINQLEALHKDLQGLEEKRELLAVDIPVDLLRTIDEGGNPDVFTAGIFERANRSNQLSKGKAQAFAGFRDGLLRAAEASYPAEAEAYKALQPAQRKEP
ncbi:hypothetical protein CVIRNUC_007557 [Coccomyxa viridis]|uniref:Mediator of RNA polymerase II transcription subunit 10 n=1 Tax=Coccomyxa viridis TaxID=1274662 RepID=A0AAV1IAF6_9CHLO|nr:hypothetical protein CVIRNUC_007557 [Coccomyxa viridis]